MSIKLNLKKNIINWLRTVNLQVIIFITIVIAIDFINDSTNIVTNTVTNIANDIYSSVSESTKEDMIKFRDYSIIIKMLLPIKFVRDCLRFIIIALWCAIIYFRFCKKDIEKQKMVIHAIGHSTLGKCQFKVDEKYNKTVELDVREFNLIEQMKSIDTNFKEISYLVNLQDIFIESFKSSINSKDNYGYMGIAHTPFILRAGYKTGDETNFIMFHKIRNKDYFEELSESEVYTPIKIEKKEIKQDTRELVVAISTTFPIDDNNMVVLNLESKSILKFKTDDLGFDVILSNKQIEQYINTILYEVRQIVRDNDIRKIHMVISSSVAFSFALGQRLSSNYDPEIIVYHYDSNNEKKYPWGISLFNDYTNCIVETEILNHNL